MSEVQVVRRPEMKAVVMKVPCSGHEVRRAWRELQPKAAELGNISREQGFVFVPEWQWATGVKELWGGVETADETERSGVPEGTELLVLPARTYAAVHVLGNRLQMNQTYEALDVWFRNSGYIRDVREGSFSIEANGLRPVNPFDIPADVIDWFDFHIYAPIRVEDGGSI
jgi:hypothetical protein